MVTAAAALDLRRDPTQAPSVHPLKAWRLTQIYFHPKWKRNIPLSVSAAAARGGWPSPTWAAWEKYPDEGGLVPSHDNMVKIFVLTHGQVRPDHFYRLPPRGLLANLTDLLNA